jgi:hypothetical protein
VRSPCTESAWAGSCVPTRATLCSCKGAADRRVTASRPIDLAEIGASASIDPVIASGALGVASSVRGHHPNWLRRVAAAVSCPPHLYAFHLL